MKKVFPWCLVTFYFPLSFDIVDCRLWLEARGYTAPHHVWYQWTENGYWYSIVEF